MTDFTKVIVSDRYLTGLLHQASKEKLLKYGGDLDLDRVRGRSQQIVQETLSLLILFDKLLIPDFIGGLHIPALEESGLITILPHEQHLNELDKDSVNPNMPFANIIETALPVSPIVLNILSQGRKTFLFWDMISKWTRIEKYRIYEAAFEYFVAFYRKDKNAMMSNILTEIIPKDLLKTIRRDLSHKSLDLEHLNPSESLLVVIMVITMHIQVLQNISRKYGVGVATRKYTDLTIGGISPNRLKQNPLDLMRGFCLLRSALHEEGHFFPNINGIKHALSLRRDPNLQSFREQLCLFHSYLAQGDAEAVVRIRAEVRKAKRVLEKTRSWKRSLKWVTYLSLPVSVVEPFLLGIPILGTTMTVFSVTGTMGVERAQKKNEWVLFGR